jgi:hypothetical protein
MTISWRELAINLETIIDNTSEIGGDDLATRVLEYVIGTSFFEEAVEHYVQLQPGYELARSVLVRLRTNSATLHCYKIYRTSNSLDEKRAAVELLSVAGTAIVLDWVPEFLSDADPEGVIPRITVSILDQLLYRHIISEDMAEPLFYLASQHTDPYIREFGKSQLHS